MKKKTATEKQLANIEEGLSKTEKFVEDNSKILFTIIGLIVFMFVGDGIKKQGSELYLNTL